MLSENGISVILTSHYSAFMTQRLGLAERVGFEPTVPLPRRMLSKHVDSSTLAPLHTDLMPGGEHLSTRSEHQQDNQTHESTQVCSPDIDRRKSLSYTAVK